MNAHFHPWLELGFTVAATFALGACEQPASTGSSSPGSALSATASGRPVASSAATGAPTQATSGSVPAASEPPKLRDAEKEVAAIAPFDGALTDPTEVSKRVAAALAICGDFRKPEVWGGEPADSMAPQAAEIVSLCAPSMAAKLLVLRATEEAKDDAEGAKKSFAFALALDPTILVPPTAPAPVRAAFAEAKKRKPGNVRLGAITATRMTQQKALEQSLATLLPHFRACYTMGLLENPDLQGRVRISAVLVDAGRVLRVLASGDIPDGRVVKCAGNVVQRAVLAPPDQSPAQISVPLVATP